MATDRPETKNNVINFEKAKQKYQNIKSSTQVLEEEEDDDDEYYFEITYDYENDDN
tara:strand:+ start:1991 stop:2158 length:168 start_codon:yes stop_codon:yes gene_type:complete